MSLRTRLARSTTNEFTAVQVREQRQGILIILHGKVYDVTEFLSKHPGGEEDLLESSGTDSTAMFEMIGHSSDARVLMEELQVGVVIPHNRSWSRFCHDQFSKRTSALFATLLLGLQRLEETGLLPLAHQAMLEEMLESWTGLDDK